MLAELLDEERLTPGKLATLSGVGRSTPYAIIRGRMRPTAEILLKLATGLATKRGGVDRDKETRYAAALLRPLGLAPAGVGTDGPHAATATVEPVSDEPTTS